MSKHVFQAIVQSWQEPFYVVATSMPEAESISGYPVRRAFPQPAPSNGPQFMLRTTNSKTLKGLELARKYGYGNLILSQTPFTCGDVLNIIQLGKSLAAQGIKTRQDQSDVSEDNDL